MTVGSFILSAVGPRRKEICRGGHRTQCCGHPLRQSLICDLVAYPIGLAVIAGSRAGIDMDTDGIHYPEYISEPYTPEADAAVSVASARSPLSVVAG
jgi:hypothetical protein